jgi:murein DD-endopeptidase MepM/ murein hydrolase activator NlpD
MKKRTKAGSAAFGISVAFASGIVFGALLLATFQRAGLIDAQGPDDVPAVEILSHQAPTVGPAAPDVSGTAPDVSGVAPDAARIGPAPVRVESFERALIVPVVGMSRDGLRSSFEEARGTSRRHEAIDILAPRNTPVVATDDGTIAKLFTSKAGGLTVYQFDPTKTYAYYYAHLERYAPGLEEGLRLRQGEVLGFVGTSGNAPPNTPHLHFAIFRLTADKRWWEGTAIDPFLILAAR